MGKERVLDTRQKFEKEVLSIISRHNPLNISVEEDLVEYETIINDVLKLLRKNDESISEFTNSLLSIFEIQDPSSSLLYSFRQISIEILASWSKIKEIY